MGKPNAFLARIEAKHEAELYDARMYTLQQAKDMMLIAARRAFGFGEERNKRLSDEFDKAFHEIAELTLADAKDDPKMWYSIEVHERELRSACGKYYVERKERYTY